MPVASSTGQCVGHGLVRSLSARLSPSKHSTTSTMSPVCLCPVPAAPAPAANPVWRQEAARAEGPCTPLSHLLRSAPSPPPPAVPPLSLKIPNSYRSNPPATLSRPCSPNSFFLRQSRLLSRKTRAVSSPQGPSCSATTDTCRLTRALFMPSRLSSAKPPCVPLFEFPSNFESPKESVGLSGCFWRPCHQ